ncbi:MAG: ABC transporter ATP-binding protein [Clostridiales bacterium]|nr:ABC transporter ATP-binding protein [Clostridiales bacterium]
MSAETERKHTVQNATEAKDSFHAEYNATEKKNTARSNSLYFHTEKLTVGYDGKPLIKEIQIQVHRGEILTLIGPNGAGKSTILKSITRQLKTISGTVFLENEALQKLSGKDLAQKMAVVLTERMHSELMTCEDIVATGRYPYTGTLGILTEEDRKKVHEAMALVHALDLCDRDFKAISDGQRQRIMLARAICQEPEIIILDEPTSFLDIRHKLELLSILKRLVTQNQVAVIMSLHELDLAQKISDTVICVKGEYIDRAGTPEEVFTSDYIQQLYGITTGSYNEHFGCIEMARVPGSPDVFVIGGGGNAVPTYRRLQRAGIPFATGVLHENDIDCEAAKDLASVVITEQAFEPVSEEKVHEAMEVLRSCKRAICCVPSFGTMNARNAMLLDEAKRLGILEDYSVQQNSFDIYYK